MLKYGLFKNHLTIDPDDYVAIPQDVESKTEEDILKEMVVPGGVTTTQAQAVFTARREAISKFLEQGYAVQTDYSELKPGIKGVFNSDEESFTNGKHTVAISSSSRKVLKNIANSIKVEKVSVIERSPIIMKFIDTSTQRENEIITPGMVGELKGGYLKCDTADETQGVFIILPDNTALRCTNYLHNTASKLMFYIPNTLSANDEINIEVRNKLGGSTKANRIGKFAIDLTVTSI